MPSRKCIPAKASTPKPREIMNVVGDENNLIFAVAFPSKDGIMA
jgi:hypothetical protein